MMFRLPFSLRPSLFSLPLFAPVLVVLAACGSGGDAPPGGMGGTPTVTVTEVEKRAIADEITFVGRVGTRDRVDIRAQVTGILAAQHFEDGATVEKGELLFEIEPDDYETAVASAKAQVASAEAKRDQAEQYLKRLKSVRTGGVSATELEQAEFDARSAAAALDQAVAALETAELDLKRTKIHAPIEGQIGKAQVDAGNLVDNSTGTLATIVRTDPIRVQHALSERFFTEAMQRNLERDPDLPPVRETLVPRITLSDGTRYPHEGEIVFLDNVVGESTGSIRAEAEFPNPEGVLRPGQFVDLSVQRGDPVDRLLVPQSAVQQDQQGHFVLVVDGEGNVTRRRVEMGERVGPRWVVDQGVDEGEKVIILGIEKVRPGAKVNAVEASAGAPTSSSASADGKALGAPSPSLASSDDRELESAGEKEKEKDKDKEKEVPSSVAGSVEQEQEQDSEDVIGSEKEKDKEKEKEHEDSQ